METWFLFPNRTESYVREACKSMKSVELALWPNIDSARGFECKGLLTRVTRNWYSREPNNRRLDLLTEVGTQCERAVIVQLLMTSPQHGIAHSLYLNLSSQFQSFPIGDVGKHELCLPNLAR
jgi:hypothetical protein